MNLLRVTRALGIRILDPAKHSATTIRPRHCFCGSTLKAIGREHGEEHLALALKLIVQSKGNESALQASIVHAVSNVIASGRVVVDGSLFDKMDTIDLGALRKWASKARIGPRAGTAEVMTTTLLMLLAPPDVVSRPQPAAVALA